MHARARTTWCLAGALLAGCAPTPPEVSSTGLESSDSGSTGNASTGVLPGSTSEGSATAAASSEGTGTGEGTTTGVPLDDGTTTGEPSTSTTSEGTGSSSEGDSTTGNTDACHPILAEVLHDAVGGNNNKQWVKLYNPCEVEIELADAYVLAWGGEDYTLGQLALEASIDPGECRVVGGPNSSNDNANPVWSQNVDFSPDLQLGGPVADGVALFLGTPEDVLADTVPLDAVIYGDANDSGLLDAEGAMPEPHVGNAGSGQSIRRTSLDAQWEIAMTPTPNECPEL